MIKDVVINSKERKVKVCENVLEIFLHYISKKQIFNRAGGILVGKQNKSNPNIIIKYTTAPFRKDKRTRKKFHRKDIQHINLFYEMYQVSNHTARYLGEWYTQDTNIPSFTKVDLKNWKRISRNCPYNQDYFHVIVGLKAFRIYLVKSNPFKVKLLGTIFWNDILNYENNRI